ncbi:MAG TPA: tRNA 2-thiouridine(34) synthase MnmA [Candidatus Krumholzibacteria bacterium]|nr:tRNA 2-thiouridine(34) synthase MnmA [Candidatus Krumholzibacteria bacterium]
MTFPLPFPQDLHDAVPSGSGVLLGVSGGVDSSVALAALTALGCRVHTVTLKNFCTSEGAFGGEGNTSCCSLDAIDAARRQAAAAGVAHWVANVEERFRERVIEPFVDEYRVGRTPNPCVGCNTWVRFPELIRRADQLGLEFVATGHYARRLDGPQGPRLLRGVDPAKDQAYFLHGLEPTHLARCVFPLGWWTKPQVREAAAALGLESARRPESQEICFVPDDDRTFLFDEADGRPGDIVDRAGRLLGRHRGLVHYTVGQRRGLGVAAGEPLYVLELDPVRNAVVAGTQDELDVVSVRCDGCRWLRRPDVERTAGLTAQIRHRHPGHAVAALRLDGDRLTADLAAPARGVAPGQFLVLADGDEILGGGRILATSPTTPGGRA